VTSRCYHVARTRGDRSLPLTCNGKYREGAAVGSCSASVIVAAVVEDMDRYYPHW
jgi:hypothetical protein